MFPPGHLDELIDIFQFLKDMNQQPDEETQRESMWNFHTLPRHTTLPNLLVFNNPKAPNLVLHGPILGPSLIALLGGIIHTLNSLILTFSLKGFSKDPQILMINCILYILLKLSQREAPGWLSC